MDYKTLLGICWGLLAFFSVGTAFFGVAVKYLSDKVRQEKHGSVIEVVNGDKIGRDNIHTEQVTGNKVSGDKIGGDQVGNDKIGGDKIEGDKTVVGDEISAESVSVEKPVMYAPNAEIATQYQTGGTNVVNKLDLPPPEISFKSWDKVNEPTTRTKFLAIQQKKSEVEHYLNEVTIQVYSKNLLPRLGIGLTRSDATDMSLCMNGSFAGSKGILKSGGMYCYQISPSNGIYKVRIITKEKVVEPWKDLVYIP